MPSVGVRQYCSSWSQRVDDYSVIILQVFTVSPVAGRVSFLVTECLNEVKVKLPRLPHPLSHPKLGGSAPPASANASPRGHSLLLPGCAFLCVDRSHRCVSGQERRLSTDLP